MSDLGIAGLGLKEERLALMITFFLKKINIMQSENGPFMGALWESLYYGSLYK